MIMQAIAAAKNDTESSSTNALMTGIQGIGASSIAQQTYASTVLCQPNIHLDILPDLPKQQAIARDQAQEWLSSINPAAISSLVNVRNFSNQVGAYVDALLPAAQKYDMGDKSQLPYIQQGIQQLLSLAQKNVTSTGVFVDNVQVYVNGINRSQSTFKAAKETVQTQITGDKGEISALRQKLNDLNKQMDADIVQISAGAVSDIIGIGMIVIAATTIIETGGATQTLLAAGITLVAGGTLAMTISSADIVKAQKEYSTTLTNLVGLELEVAVFDTVYNQLTASERLSQSAIDAAKLLVNGWQTVADSYQQTLADLQQSSKGYLALRLSAMKRQWQQLGEQAGSVMQLGPLPFNTVPANELKSSA